MVCKVLFPIFGVPQLDMVSGSYERNALIQFCAPAQFFVQQEPSLAVEFDFAGQGKADSLECYRFVRGSILGDRDKGDLLEVFLRVQAEDAVCAEDKIEITAVFVGVDLIPEFVGDEHSAFAIDDVFVFAC